MSLSDLPKSVWVVADGRGRIWSENILECQEDAATDAEAFNRRYPKDQSHRPVRYDLLFAADALTDRYGADEHGDIKYRARLLLREIEGRASS